MKRILVGVDGSRESRKAATFAAEIATATGAELVLAHVAPPTPSPLGPEELLGKKWTEEKEERERADAIAREVSGAGAGPSLKVETVHLRGYPPNALAELAKEFDLVVVGHRGRNAVARVLIGSVADRLAQISPRPVLIVRDAPAGS